MIKVIASVTMLFVSLSRADGNHHKHWSKRKKHHWPQRKHHKTWTKPNCEYYELQDSSIVLHPLPDVDLTDRAMFPDVNEYGIDKIQIEICEQAHGDVSTTFTMKGTGFPLEVPTTVWAMFDNVSHPLFAQGYAVPFIPLSATTAAFTNGRDIWGEPNTVNTMNRKGDFQYSIDLDYNPLKAHQAPLTNQLSGIQQSAYCDMETLSDFPNLCQVEYKTSGKYTFVGMEYLREFDANGQQMLDQNGNAKIVRAPSALSMLVFVAHIDGLTHGIEDETQVAEAAGLGGDCVGK
eukprot:480578_1